MNNLDFIAAFDPFKDDNADFLSRVRDQFDESYGKWSQEVNDKAGDDEFGTITVVISTGGWSDNESVVSAMLSNDYVSSLFYESWYRGGRFTFKFYPRP